MSRRRGKRRVRHDIIIEILQNSVDGAKKTHIMHGANLSFRALERYLNALKKAGFITENNGIWKTTEKGLQVTEACKICQRLMEKLV